MGKPLVTLCVPTIGRLDYLPQTRRSVEAQTFGNFEVLVLDNASPEPAREFFAEWAKADPRVRILRVDPRIPMLHNFKRGLKDAAGSYVTFFHDDDVYSPEFLAKQVAILEAHPRAGMSGSNYDFIDEGGQITERRRWIKRTEIWRGRDYIRTLFRRGRNPIPMPGLVFRTPVLDAVFDENISIYFGDFVLLMRLAEAHDVAVLTEPLVSVRRHKAQASLGVSWSETVAFRSTILRQYCADYLERWPHDGPFVASLERALDRSQRSWFIWGWISATNDDEANECLSRLAASNSDAKLTATLRHVTRLGVRNYLRQHSLLRLIKKFGTAAGI